MVDFSVAILTGLALDVARGVEAQSADSDQTDIANNLFLTSLQQLAGQATTLGASLARQGRQQAVAVLAKLDRLGDRLAKPTPAERDRVT